MTVKNKTSVTLRILSESIEPEASRSYGETMFNALDVHSEIGSCVIITEYGKRSFECFGKIRAKEGEELDENGMKEIIIFSLSD